MALVFKKIESKHTCGFKYQQRMAWALALKEQEELAAEMALDEVALANSMAIKCLETNFVECDY